MRGKALSLTKIQKIKQLRSHGYSLPEISLELKIPKTTVFRYVKNIVILPQYKSLWFGKRGGSRKRKILKEKEAFGWAESKIDNLTSREKLLVLCSLYWAEGSKKDLGLSNSDPKLIGIYVQFLRECFDISGDRLRVSIRIYEDLDREKCLEFWEKIVGVPKENFVSVDVLHGRKTGKLLFGMCRVRVLKGGDVLKKIVATNKIVSGNLPL